MQGVPMLVSEDGSANVARLDCIGDNGKVWVYGLNGGRYEVQNLADLKGLLRHKGVATSFYVYMLVSKAARATSGVSMQWMYVSATILDD
jgi:hypothetical protein